jgi:hypothetical protein
MDKPPAPRDAVKADYPYEVRRIEVMLESCGDSIKGAGEKKADVEVESTLGDLHGCTRGRGGPPRTKSLIVPNHYKLMQPRCSAAPFSQPAASLLLHRLVKGAYSDNV